MNLAFFLGLLTLGGTLFAFRSPTEEELVALFEEAQQFYAEGAYDQAISQYEHVAQVRSRILDTQAIQAMVGEESYPVQEAALYQIGNAHIKLHEEYTGIAEDTRDASRRGEYRTLADSAFGRARNAFEQVIEQAVSPVLKGQAYGRLVELYFEAEAYPQVVDVAQRLIEAYGDTPYAIEGYYNTGWAYYKMESYTRAVEAFETLLAVFPTGYQADRSLFQIGECYLEMGEYVQAIGYYSQLVERQRIEDLSEEELRRIKREKLAGLVDETALELAAKAEIRVGTCYARLGQYAEGLEAYQRVISLFSSERQLVEEAYLRMADLYQEKGDWDAALQTYRQAIDQSTDRTLKARIQYALAERLFSQERYRRAIQEYRIYLKGYGDIAGLAGFSEERVHYRIGSAYQQLGQERLESGQDAAEWLAQGIAQYDSILTNAASPYLLDARFNRALALQALGTNANLEEAREEYERVIRETTDPLYIQQSLVQLAELHFARSQYARAAERARELLEGYADSDFRNEAHMRLALSLQATGELDGAVRSFLAIAEDSPYFSSARLGCGHAYLNQKRYTAAVDALEAGLQQADEERKAAFHYLLGQAHGGLQLYSRAIAHYTTALDYPLDGDLEETLRFSRGNTAFLAENYALGGEDFNWVVEHVRDPEKVKFAQDALALAYLKQNRGSAAIQVLDDMVAATESPEEQARLLSRIMDLHYERDDYAETTRIARRLIDLEFDDTPAAGQLYGFKEKAFFLLGDALLRQQQAEEGVAVFQQALQRHPDSYFALSMRLNLATHHFALGDLEQAKAEFIALAGGYLDQEQRLIVSFYLANIHYSLREFEDARQLFEGLLGDYPAGRELPDILFGLGESHYQLGEFEAAIGYYQRLLAQFPDETAADDALYNMGWCLIELKREDEAMRSFTQLLERYPQSEFAPSAQFTFGDYAYNRGAYPDAIEAYSRVAERYPDAPVAAQVPRLLAELNEAVAYQRYERGIAYMDSAEAMKRTEYFEQAITVFAEVRERFPSTESGLGALSNMGVCLEGLGKWREAVEVYDEVIQMYEEKQATKEAFQFAKAHRDWIVTTRL